MSSWRAAASLPRRGRTAIVSTSLLTANKLTRAAADGRRTCSVCWDPARCSASCRCSTRAPRTSTASAVTEATVAALAHDALRRLLLERPECIYVHMLQALARAPSAGQRRGGQPGLHRRPRPRGKNLLTWPTSSPAGKRRLHVHHDLTQEELRPAGRGVPETVNEAWPTSPPRLAPDLGRSCSSWTPSACASAPAELSFHDTWPEWRYRPVLAMIIVLGRSGSRAGRGPDRSTAARSTVDIGIDHGHDLGGRLRACGEADPNLVQAFRPVRQVIVDVPSGSAASGRTRAAAGRPWPSASHVADRASR